MVSGSQGDVVRDGYVKVVGLHRIDYGVMDM